MAFMKQSAAAGQAEQGDRFRWLVLVTVTVGVIASLISSTIFNVAIPTLSQEFGLGQARAQWVASIFMLTTTVAMLVTPWLLSRFGYRTSFLCALAVMLLSAIGGGLASDFELVLVARAVGGFAAGVIQPLPAIIIMKSFEKHEQGRANGIFGMGSVLAPAIGPSLGGILVEMAGWRSMFFFIVPFCALALFMGLKFMSAASSENFGNKKQPLDWTGLSLATLGTLLLLNGLVTLKDGVVSSELAVAMLLLSVVCLVSFVFWQLRLISLGRAPLMDLRLFACGPFAAGCLVSLVYGAALFGLTYMLPVFMQLGLEFPAAVVGTPMLPAGLILGAVMALAGKNTERVSADVMVIAGLMVMAASFMMTGIQQPGTSIWWLIIFTVISRIGLGIMLPSLMLGSMRPLDKDLIAQGASVFAYVRVLGGTAGVSLCGILIDWRGNTHGSGQGMSLGLDAFRDTYMLLSILCVLAAFFAFRLRVDRPKAHLPRATDTLKSR